jgi:hypothetical protein
LELNVINVNKSETATATFCQCQNKKSIEFRLGTGQL